MSNITVKLTAYNMGPNATEEDFDSFASYVAEHIDERTGLDVTVDQFRFAGSGQAEDAISCDTEEQRETIREALTALWEEWCARPESTVETVADRIARLSLTDIGEVRLESLTIAHPFVDDATFARLSDAARCSRASTIVLPAHRLEGLSRGKGWCRQGRGDSAVWGERTKGGYRVGPGRWIVGGSDGFSRKGQDEWTVEAVTVGAETWTIAY